VSNQEQGTINQQKPSAGEMKRTFWRTLEQRLPIGASPDGVDIDLPSSEEIKGALKYMRINKAAGAELLKNGGPDLVDTLHEVIQQAWTSETLPRSWTEVTIKV
jgi:hypothetical protein